MKAQEIYDLLRAGGLSRAGALGLMGNMMAESTLKENIAQRGMTKLTDEQYTAASDNGLLDFPNDSVGFGLCQWTERSRKRALLNRAKQDGCSVGDGKMQVRFCLDELKGSFQNVFQTLSTSDSIDECSDLVCSRYEMPAVNNFLIRRNFAHELEAQISETAPSIPDAEAPVDPSIAALQFVMQYNGYWGKVTGQYSDEFIRDLKTFADDIASMHKGGG